MKIIPCGRILSMLQDLQKLVCLILNLLAKYMKKTLIELGFTTVSIYPDLAFALS